MRRFFSILIVFLLCGRVSADVVIQLKNTVSVASADLKLKDVVVDPSMIPEEWRERRVFAAPAAGDIAYHSLTAIAYALQRYRDMSRVVLRGEPVISVKRLDRKLEKSEMREPILSYLKRTDPWKKFELEVKVVSIPSNLRVAEGVTTYDITQIDQKTAKGYSIAYVDVFVDGMKEEAVPVGIEIQSLTEVWVVKDVLPRGHILASIDLMKERRVVDATVNYVPASEDLTGYEITRRIDAGEVLKHNSVSKPLCVKRGDWVSINAYGETLHITLRGKALSNGRLGDRIMCVNERSQRQVLVELTGIGFGKLVRM
jgi:flagella basal body P-ring formation protein FlgA